MIIMMMMIPVVHCYTIVRIPTITTTITTIRRSSGRSRMSIVRSNDRNVMTMNQIQRYFGITTTCKSSRSSNHDDTTTTTTTTDIPHSNPPPPILQEIGVGIDLGTTNSAIAYLKDNRIPTILSIPHNGRTIPSIVAIVSTSTTQDNTTQSVLTSTIVVGQLALEQQPQLHPKNNTEDSDKNDQIILYRNVKRIIGTGGKVLVTASSSTNTNHQKEDISFIVPHVQVSKTGKTYSKFNVWNQLYDSIHHPTLLLRRPPQAPGSSRSSHNNNNNSMKNVDHVPDHANNTDANDTEQDIDNDLYIRPELISSYIIQTLKNATEQQLKNVIVTRAVIGVPAYFNEAQRNATIRAAQFAGIHTIKLLREPEAAALAYGFQSEDAMTQDVTTFPPSTGKRLNHKKMKNNQDYDDDDDDVNDDELVLVFDLGGGTYDVSILYTSRQDQIMEIIATSGNTELGGSTFDSKIALYLQQQIRKYQQRNRSYDNEQTETENSHENRQSTKKSIPKSIIVLAAEAIRIYLSNHRIAHLLLPVNDNAWLTTIAHQPSSVIVTPNHKNNDTTLFVSNSTHLYLPLTRKEMETICTDEILALLRPIREVAIMANALLPGDSSPSIVAAAALLDEQYEDNEDDDDFDGYTYTPQKQSKTNTASTLDDFYSETDIENDANLLLLSMTSSKKSQQQGRKRARDVAKEERKYRQAKKDIAMSASLSGGGGGSKHRISSTATTTSATKNPKIRDGISGRPISRIVLVGGATRMPCIGRLLTVVTGIVPQKTVNPDEAVALGCAVQVGIYDGQPNMGTVLTPMQAAILRATTTSPTKLTTGMLDDTNSDDDNDDDFDDGVVY